MLSKDSYARIRYQAGSFLNTLLYFDHITSSAKSLIYEDIRIEKKRIAIIATYYPERAGYVQQLHKNIQDAGFQVIRVRNSRSRFVSTSEISRKNAGFDLGIFRDVLRQVYLDMEPGSRYEILYLNDSMRYEQGTIEEILRLSKAKQPNTIYSLLESFQRGWHLQSFLFYIDADYESVTKLLSITNRFRNWRYKRTAVHYGERSLPKYLKEAGLLGKALFPIDTLIQVQSGAKNSLDHADVNPTYSLIRELEKFDIKARKWK